eukprot:Phypoly_transcript_06498.p1 GENE.Phypoly_transcript_06498~~Phypoly_transcript_06498.p1  ORF type:complete len:546 (+),score=66.46 Phypoly_transcript_06498:68-1705(+)
MKKNLLVVVLLVLCAQLYYVACQEIATCTEEKGRHGWRCNGKVYTDPGHHDTFPSGAFWIDLLIIFFMVIIAGIMSGLTLGLLSLDIMNLEIIIKTGEPKDVRNAKRILPLVKKHHQLLVTLLLTNAAAMEALPIALDRLVPEWAAIVLSITLVLMFGEIIPQALCSRYGLRIGASLAWLVWIVMYLLTPISYPLGKALDHFLGKEEGTYFNRSELRELLAMHAGPNAPPGQGLTIDETTIMRGALELNDKVAQDIMTPISKVFMLNSQEYLDDACLQRIYESKKSRIPIYRESEDGREGVSIIGCLLVKSLIALHGANPKIEDLNLRHLPQISPDMSLYDLLNLFQEGKSHMAIVDEDGIALGIVTLEDVIEELIQEEIYDESDVTNVRINHVLRIRSPKELEKKGIRRSNSDPNAVTPQALELRAVQKAESNPYKRRTSVAVMDKSRLREKRESEGGGGERGIERGKGKEKVDEESGSRRKQGGAVARFSSPLVRSSPRLREDTENEREREREREGEGEREGERKEGSHEEDDEPVPPGTPLL